MNPNPFAPAQQQTLLALRKALSNTRTVLVATVPVIAVLKMAAWLDRPGERDRDLDDLAHIMNDHLEADDIRRWEDDLINAGLPHDDQSAFALGQDVARIAQASHLAIVEGFLKAVEDEASSANARFARCFGQRDATDVVASRLQAFQRGLQAKP